MKWPRERLVSDVSGTPTLRSRTEGRCAREEREGPWRRANKTPKGRRGWPCPGESSYPQLILQGSSQSLGRGGHFPKGPLRSCSLLCVYAITHERLGGEHCLAVVLPLRACAWWPLGLSTEFLEAISVSLIPVCPVTMLNVQ